LKIFAEFSNYLERLAPSLSVYLRRQASLMRLDRLKIPVSAVQFCPCPPFL
jgi:hypothetical protein